VVDTKILQARGIEARKYFRKWGRNSVALPAKIEIRTDDGRLFTSGTAIIRDISLKGARLAKFVLKRMALPAQVFRVHLEFKSAEMQGIGAVARPIRFGQGREFELAVEFEDLWAKEERPSPK
jgi:hypothetical protein